MSLKEYRISKGFRQIDVANQIGVNRSCVARWESGENIPSLSKIIKLSEILGVSELQLIKEFNSKK